MDAGEFSALATQVGGHPGIQNSADGSLVAKACLPAELSFYQEIASNVELAPLRPLVPKFYGTLTLHGRVAPSNGADAQITIVPVADVQQKESILLENVANSFIKPAVLDVKLGTVLAEETASDEKKERMAKAARDTTSFETGVRLTGFQVYNHDTQAFDVIDKKYGKSIKTADLPDGMAKFLPVATRDESGILHGHGLPAALLVRVIDGIVARLRTIETALQTLEFRMVGASALIIYESDVPTLERGLENYVPEEDGLELESDDEDEDEESDDDDAEQSAERVLQKSDPILTPYTVKLIDFAHTHLTPGRGSDEGVLLGLTTSISLLEGRKAQLVENA